MDITFVIVIGSVILGLVFLWALSRDRSSYDAIATALRISRETDTQELVGVWKTLEALGHTSYEEKRDADYQVFLLAKRWVNSIDPYFRFAGSLLNFAYLTTNLEVGEGIIWSSANVRHTLVALLNDCKKALDERDKTKLFEFFTNFCMLALLGYDFREVWVIESAPIRNEISADLFNDLKCCANSLDETDTFKAYTCLDQWRERANLVKLPRDLVLPLLRIRQRVACVPGITGPQISEKNWEGYHRQLALLIRRLSAAMKDGRYDSVIDLLVQDQTSFMELMPAGNPIRKAQVAPA